MLNHLLWPFRYVFCVVFVFAMRYNIAGCHVLLTKHLRKKMHLYIKNVEYLQLCVHSVNQCKYQNFLHFCGYVQKQVVLSDFSNTHCNSKATVCKKNCSCSGIWSICYRLYLKILPSFNLSSSPLSRDLVFHYVLYIEVLFRGRMVY